MSYTLTSPSLKTLLEDARVLIEEKGVHHETQRGTTFSLNNVMLTWENPEEDTASYSYWDKEADDWYQEYFVAKRDANDPAALVEEGQPLYSYTYAHRSRFWDGGWGYVMSVIRALQNEGISKIPHDRTQLEEMLQRAGRHIHLQTILAVLFWMGREDMNRFLPHPEWAEAQLTRMRMDTLQNAIEEIQENSSSRRAVTVSFVYPAIDFALRPALSVPPYQFFQLLPADAVDAPIASSHVHRSLDVAGGAQLDFHHDLSWLREAAAITKRPVGDITVIAHNLHLYVAGGESENAHLTAKTTIREWLDAVSDGYAAGSDAVDALCEKDVYKQNIARLFEAWHH